MNASGNTGWGSTTQVVLAWIGVALSKLGIYHWSDFAAITTTVLTLLLIFDNLRKKWKSRERV